MEMVYDDDVCVTRMWTVQSHGFVGAKMPLCQETAT